MFQRQQESLSYEELVSKIKKSLAFLKGVLMALVILLVVVGVEIAAIVISVPPEQRITSTLSYCLVVGGTALMLRRFVASLWKWTNEGLTATLYVHRRKFPIGLASVTLFCTGVMCLLMILDAPGWMEIPALVSDALFSIIVLTGAGVLVRTKLLSYRLYLSHFSREERAVIRARKRLERLAVWLVAAAALPSMYGLVALLGSLLQRPPLGWVLLMLCVLAVVGRNCYTVFYRPQAQELTQAFQSVEDVSVLSGLWKMWHRVSIVLVGHVLVVTASFLFLPWQPWPTSIYSLLPLIIVVGIYLLQLANLNK